MRYLLDTCAISELSKQSPNSDVVEYLLSLPVGDTFLSSTTIGEIRRGIARLPHGKKRLHLERFLERQIEAFAANILSYDVEASLIWGDMYASCQQRGINLGSADSLIAAIALQNGLHIVTRNVKDFEPTGAMIINPWANEG